MNRIFRTSSPFHLSPFWKLVSYVILLFWAFIVIFPLYWMLVTSFKQPIDVASGPKFVPFVDYQPSLDAWQEMLIDNGIEYVGRPYVTTVIVAITSATVALLIGITVGTFAIGRHPFESKVISANSP